VKCSPQGETLYVSEFYQFQNQDVVTKHIFVGNTRIVPKLSKYNNTSSLHKTDYEGSNIYTYHPDHIGSSNFITDMAGNKFEHIEYTPYGETWIDEGSKVNIIGYRFTGKELDTETGLYYYGARYLDLQSSRWMSVDPILSQYMPEQSLNDEARQKNGKLPGMGGVFNPVNLALYHYSANNPISYVDPDGLAGMYVEFLGYMVDTDYGFKIPLVHAGVVAIDPVTGATKYYEYGRYDFPINFGLVQTQPIPDLVMNSDGRPTPESFLKLLSYLTENCGHGTPVSYEYYGNADLQAIINFAENRMYDSNREPYSVYYNNCVKFATDAISAGMKAWWRKTLGV